MDYLFRWLALKYLPKDALPGEDASITEGNRTVSGNGPGSVHAKPAGVGTNSDAPACHNCGAIMVRSGSCYRCLNCGETSGCS